MNTIIKTKNIKHYIGNDNFKTYLQTKDLKCPYLNLFKDGYFSCEAYFNKDD